MPPVRRMRPAYIEPNAAPANSGWADRCQFWLREMPATQPANSRRRQLRQPLIVTGHGASIRIDRGSLLVRGGFTHYPQEREQWRLFPGDWRLPSRIVILDCDGSLTFDALAWLAEQGVPLVQINWCGDVVHVVGASPHSANSELVPAQLAPRNDEQRRIAIARRLISEKINNSIETLRIALPQSPAIERALQKLDRDADQMRHHAPSSVSGLLGIEGRAGFAYFNAWRSFPLRWKEASRRPIPDEWRRIGQRSSYVSKKSNPNRGATHPVNAMLNYAYGILETQVRAHVIAAGLDPMIGFFHGSRPLGKTALVYDLMEPLRPIVDRALLQFVQRTTFSPFDFSLTPSGICRLNPQLARNIVKLASEPSETIEDVIKALLCDLTA